MRSLKWNISHAVFVADIDDEHQEIFEAVAHLRESLSGHEALPEILSQTQRLAMAIVGHFAHEERIMRAARYDSLSWHQGQHRAALRRAKQFITQIEKGDLESAAALVDYLTDWLHAHTRLADQMLGAFLRNQRRVWKVTFHAGTKPVATP
jgi:hemerythrin-like metal-binding protein